MNQDRTVKKALFCMKQEGILPDDPVKVARIEEYLNWIFVIGAEERGKELTAHNKKKLIMENRNHEKIRDFDSVIEAARKLKIGVTGIYSAIERGSRTKKGYYFRYADEDTL